MNPTWKCLTWWYWVASAGLIGIWLLGFEMALEGALALTFVHAMHMSIASYPGSFQTQIPIGYLLLLIAGMWEPLRVVHWAQLVGTITMVVVGYCPLARLLTLLPWNRDEPFSLNLLRALNRELGSDFDLDSFRYRSFYDDEEGRIETYLHSLCDQVVHFPDGVEITLSKGESIRTEISTKYDRRTLDDLFAQSGLVVDRWIEDELGYYALVLAAPLPA